MALLPILTFPDKRLRTIAKDVTEFDDNLLTLIDDMLETMYDAPGIGLAASQVDVHIRLITIDLSDEGDDPLVLINPSIEILDEDSDKMQEGCLSIPGFYEEIVRPKHIRVHTQDVKGEEYSFEATDLLAVCIQHEMDHLNGKLFVDYLSKLKRNRIKSKLEKSFKRG